MITLSPENVENIQLYTQQLTEFLNIYMWIADAYVSDFFVRNHWDRLPECWKSVLSNLTTEEFSFLLDRQPRVSLRKVAPLSLLSFKTCCDTYSLDRQCVSDPGNVLQLLTDSKCSSGGNSSRTSIKHDSNIKVKLSPLDGSGKLHAFFRKHVKPKKQHEIKHLGEVVYLLSQYIDCENVVDVGAGLGHLARLLSFGYNLNVTSVEAADTHAPKATKYDREIDREIKKKSQFGDGKHSVVVNESSLPCHVTSMIYPNMTTDEFIDIITVKQTLDTATKVQQTDDLYALATKRPDIDTKVKLTDAIDYLARKRPNTGTKGQQTDAIHSLARKRAVTDTKGKHTDEIDSVATLIPDTDNTVKLTDDMHSSVTCTAKEMGNTDIDTTVSVQWNLESTVADTCTVQLNGHTDSEGTVQKVSNADDYSTDTAVQIGDTDSENVEPFCDMVNPVKNETESCLSRHYYREGRKDFDNIEQTWFGCKHRKLDLDIKTSMDGAHDTASQTDSDVHMCSASNRYQKQYKNETCDTCHSGMIQTRTTGDSDTHLLASFQSDEDTYLPKNISDINKEGTAHCESKVSHVNTAESVDNDVMHTRHQIECNTIDTRHQIECSTIDTRLQIDPGKWRFVLTGLHACGDLTPTFLRFFVSCDAAVGLVSVGCCYMKISDDSCGVEPAGYPMSRYIASLPQYGLSYSSRELACHFADTYSQRLKECPPHLKIHSYRAALEWVANQVCPSFQRVAVQIPTKKTRNMQFESYARIGLQKLRIPVELLTDDLLSQAAKLTERWKDVVAFYTLRLALAPVVETLVLLDRMFFLYQHGYVSALVPVFDPGLSPRNFVLLSWKDHRLL